MQISQDVLCFYLVSVCESGNLVLGIQSTGSEPTAGPTRHKQQSAPLTVHQWGVGQGQGGRVRCARSGCAGEGPSPHCWTASFPGRKTTAKERSFFVHSTNTILCPATRHRPESKTNALPSGDTMEGKTDIIHTCKPMA
jgi:hypothetical protein